MPAALLVMTLPLIAVLCSAAALVIPADIGLRLLVALFGFSPSAAMMLFLENFEWSWTL